jgi:cytochrome c oxidase subunit 2
MRREVTHTAILWFTLTLIVELLLPYLPFPLAAAQEALVSDESFRLLLVLGAPVFTFVVSVMAYSLWKFRARDGELEDGTPIKGSSWVASVWLAITGGLCLSVIVHPGLTGMARFLPSQDAELVVRVTGRQWAWDVEYPAEGLAGVSELVLPMGQRVRFEVTSADVLHSFWIPAFRNKVDAVPGRTTVMYVTPTQLGSFKEDYNLRVQCAEICGTQHSTMSMPVRIVSAADFKTWVQAQTQAAASDPVSRGKQLAQSLGCAACHSVDGSVAVGPSWKDLAGSQVPLADGTTVTADDTYLHESIVNPNAKIVEGFRPDIMPGTFGTTLTGDQLNDLIAYIKSLSPGGN